MSAVGVQIAGNVCVGKSMGARNVPLAKKYLVVVTLYAFVLFVILCGALMIFKYDVSSLFTDQ